MMQEFIQESLKHPSPLLKNLKVMIGEHDVTTRRLLQTAIQDWGYEVIEVSNGIDAWQVLNQPDPPLLLVIDWSMPKLDGLGLCSLIKKELAFHPYIILLSETSGTTTIVQALEAGADEFLGKPCNMDELRSRLSVGAKIIGFKMSLAEQNQQLNHYLNQIESLAEMRARQFNLHTDFISMLGGLIVEITKEIYESLNNIDFEKNIEPAKDQQEKTNLIELHRTLKKIMDLIQGLQTESAHLAATLSCNMNEVLQNSLDICRIPLKQVNVQFTANPELPILSAEKFKLSQAFVSLFLNMIQIFKRERTGHLTVETAHIKEKNSILIITECSGPLISPNDLGKIFQPYWGFSMTSDMSLKLSVVMSRDIFQKYSGTLRIEARPEGGLRFIVELPLEK